MARAGGGDARWPELSGNRRRRLLARVPGGFGAPGPRARRRGTGEWRAGPGGRTARAEDGDGRKAAALGPCAGLLSGVRRKNPSERPGLEGSPGWGRLVTLPTGLWNLPSGPVVPLSSSQAECRTGSFLANNKNFFFFRADKSLRPVPSKKFPFVGICHSF